MRRHPLTIREILSWADAYRETTGNWPTRNSGSIRGVLGETWARVDRALHRGLRGLPGDLSLAQLLADQRGKRHRHYLPPLSEEQILAWADAHFHRTSQWPTRKSGRLADDPKENWSAIDGALRHGTRGLPGGSSLARLLSAQRGLRNRQDLPPLTEAQILAWADAHQQRTGNWPSNDSGAIVEASGETWSGIAVALHQGHRGLPGGSSLAWLLAEQRGVVNGYCRLPLSADQILIWADAFHQRTGQWPNLDSGPIPEAPNETWHAINKALRHGWRGLAGGTSLAQLLASQRGVRNQTSVPRLRRKQILAWADAYRRRSGDWPSKNSGSIHEAPEETWAAVDAALQAGTRGLRGGSSLASLLARARGRRNHVDLPPLTIKKLLAWADAYFARTGRWPRCKSGSIAEAPGETWKAVDAALREGRRGLPGGSSLTRLLARKRGARNPARLPPLSQEQILAWADAHRRRTGAWPHAETGAVAEAAGETWLGIDNALRCGRRGLESGSSLARLLEELRGVSNKANRPPLTEEQILLWADAYSERTGRRPTKNAGPIAESPGETWLGVDTALRAGLRGLAGDSSLAQLLTTHGREKVSAEVT
jgi:hypothetical protein